jgi:hypothetical protein
MHAVTYPPHPSDPRGQQYPPVGPPAYAPVPSYPQAPPRRRKNAGTAVTAGILGLLTALIYGGYGLLATIVMVDKGVAEGWLFAIPLVAGVVALTGSIMVFAEKSVGGVLLLVASGLFTVGSALLAVVPIPDYLNRGPDDPRMLLHLVGILPVAIITVLVLLPSTRRYLASEPDPVPGQPMPVAAPNPAGQAMAIGAAVCGFILGLILLSIWIDVGVAPTLGLDVLPQVLGVLLAVVGGAVALGRKWSGGLLLAIGGGVCLAYILVALFRTDGETDFRGVVFLLASIGALVLPLLPPTRTYLRRS